MFRLRRRKRVMRKCPLARVRILLKKRKINHPREGHHVRVTLPFRTHIEFVGAELLHRLFMREDWKRFLPYSLPYRLGDINHQPFNQVKHISLLHKSHLKIYLRMLELAVAAKVFIPHRARELIVTLEARKHEKLFVLLWCLRKRVELPRLHARWHQEVSRAFRRGFGEHWSFYLNEVISVHVLANKRRYLVAKTDIFLHQRASQVEVTVFET